MKRVILALLVALVPTLASASGLVKGLPLHPYLPLWDVVVVSPLASTSSSGVGNNFFAVSGPASTTKTFTFPNADSTILTGTGTNGNIFKLNSAGVMNDSFIKQTASGICIAGPNTCQTSSADLHVTDAANSGTIFALFGGTNAGTFTTAAAIFRKSDDSVTAVVGYDTTFTGFTASPVFMGTGAVAAFGTYGAYDSIFAANNVEQMRLISGGIAPKLLQQVLTAGTMNAETLSQVRSTWHSYTWTNAMIVALGAVASGDITVATLPAKTVVNNAYVVILTPDTSANALSVACGRAGATYIDYITAQDAKAVANTVYGDASAERGTNLTGYDLPSYTATTDVKCHFIKTTTTLDTVLGSTGRVILNTSLVP